MSLSTTAPPTLPSTALRGATADRAAVRGVPAARTAPPAPPRVGRSRRAQTLVLVIVGLVSGALLVRQISAVDLAGTLAAASPTWLAVAVGASLVPFLGAALCLTAFTPGRLPLGRATGVQVASSYASIVLPPTVGQLAVNAQFLRRLGHSGPAVTATVALTQLSGLLVTLALLAAAVTATSTTVVVPASVLVTAAAVLAAVLLLARVPGVRYLVATTLTGALREVRPRLRELTTQPARLAAGVGGSLLLPAGYVVALDASLRAVGATLPLAQVAVVMIVGTALGSAAPTPGGTIVVEAALIAGLVAAGVPAATALPAVLLYRATTLWLRVAPGWAAMILLRRRGVL